MDWAAIKGLRNIVVHEYGKVRLRTLWDIAAEDVPKLRQFCEDRLPENF